MENVRHLRILCGELAVGLVGARTDSSSEVELRCLSTIGVRAGAGARST
jgi:hypothetical protein